MLGNNFCIQILYNKENQLEPSLNEGGSARDGKVGGKVGGGKDEFRDEGYLADGTPLAELRRKAEFGGGNMAKGASGTKMSKYIA